MAIVRYRALRGAACLALLAIAACARESQDEMSWARAALERNDRIEVVSADPQSRTFTVRVKDTGELRMVRADQVIAGPSLPATATAPAQIAAVLEANRRRAENGEEHDGGVATLAAGDDAPGADEDPGDGESSLPQGEDDAGSAC